MSLKDEICKLYWEDRLSQKEIGEVYGKSYAWIYKQMKKYKIPSRRTEGIKNRFLNYVKIPQNPNDCWEWIGGKNHYGYGNFRYNGKPTYAHRVSYILFIKEFDQTLCCLHKCDLSAPACANGRQAGNPGCVNPDHLFLGTQKDNIEDKKQKGRARNGGLKGEQIFQSKLTEEEVKEIKILLVQGISNIEIGRLFNVVHGTISNIKRGKSWKHINP